MIYSQTSFWLTYRHTVIILVRFSKGFDMETKLTPIFTLRSMFLQRINPRFFARNEDYITKTSLAAQDYFQSDEYGKYNRYIMGRTFKSFPGYINVHKKYSLPYNPNTPIGTTQGINSGLVMDLTWSYGKDVSNNIIDRDGNILHPEALHNSEVLQVYHNSELSGVPASALKLLLPSELKQILAMVERGGR